jgi:hypothetical protein
VHYKKHAFGVKREPTTQKSVIESCNGSRTASRHCRGEELQTKYVTSVSRIKCNITTEEVCANGEYSRREFFRLRVYIRPCVRLLHDPASSKLLLGMGRG